MGMDVGAYVEALPPTRVPGLQFQVPSLLTRPALGPPSLGPGLPSPPLVPEPRPVPFQGLRPTPEHSPRP